MKTLLEKMKTEYYEVLENEVKLDFPQSYEQIVKTITTKEYINDLTIWEANRIVLYLVGLHGGLDGIYQIFDI